MQFKYILKFFGSQPIEYILLYNYAPAPRCTTHHYMLPAPQYATPPVSLIFYGNGGKGLKFQQKMPYLVFMRSSLDKKGFVNISKKITLDRAYMPINGRLDRTLTAYLFHKKIPSSDRVVQISIRRENTAPPAARLRSIFCL